MSGIRTLLSLATAAALLLPIGARAQHAGHTMPLTVPMPAEKQATQPAAAPTRKPVKKSTAQPATPKPTAPEGGHSQMEGMDHSRMEGMDHSKMKEMDHSKMEGMDHSKMEGMDHSSMEGMDHSKMDHSKMEEMDHSKMARMDHSKMEGTDHSKMDHAAMGHGVAIPVTPIPMVTDADRLAAFPDVHLHHLHGTAIQSFWLLDRLEVSDADPGTALGWEGSGWIGGDVQRLWLRTEGEAFDGRVEHGDIEVLYGRSVRAWWDVMAGVRQDIGDGPSRTWAAFGVQGLAPYKFDVAATAYVGAGGRTAARVEAEYDTLFTNRLILQWRAEAHAYGKPDPLAGVGSGVSTLEAGLRLRYEVTRQFAPYIGIQHERAIGNTADLRRAAGHGASDTRVVAGVRVWF